MFLMKPFYDGVNRSQKVPPATSVAHTLHPLSHIMGRHVAARCFECHADRIGQSQSILFDKLRLTAQTLQGGDSLSEFHDGFLSFLCAILSPAQDFNLLGEISFRLVQCILVSICGHTV